MWIVVGFTLFGRISFMKDLQKQGCVSSQTDVQKKSAWTPTFNLLEERRSELVPHADRPHARFCIAVVDFAEIFVFQSHVKIFGEIIGSADAAPDTALVTVAPKS